MIYLVIPEPFSATDGIALAKIAADFMRYEPNTMVVCPSADDSWGYSTSRVLLCPVPQRFQRGGLRGWRFIPMWIRRLLITPWFAPLLAKLASDDVVWFLNWWEMAEPIREEIRRRGAKLVYHVNNSHRNTAKSKSFRRFDPDAIVFLSDAMRHEIETDLPEKIPLYTIHNGCEESRFWPSAMLPDNCPPLVLFVGRLTPYKGAHVLLEAIKILNERKIPAQCRVVGSTHAQAENGKPSPYVRSLHQSAQANVTFKGFLSGTEIANEYRASDILCCPSIFEEPFGLVNIEAMACGLPVVASRTGGIPEIASLGGIILFDPGDSEDLANKLQPMLLDRKLRLEVRTQGLASFKRNFTAAGAVRRYVEVAESLLRGGTQTNQRRSESSE